MHKVIEKCKALCDKEIEKLKDKVDEAQRSYWDTGYQRYYNQMYKAQEELEEIEGWLFRDDIAKEEATRYKRMYNDLVDSLYVIKSLTRNITDDDITSLRVQELIKHLKNLEV